MEDGGPRTPAGGSRQLWLFPEADLPARAPARPRARGSLEAVARRRYPERRVSVVYTLNRTVILSMRSLPDGGVTLRAHECFREAPPEVIESVVRLYLGRPSRAQRRQLSSIVAAWHQTSALPPPSPSPGALVHGRFHHLPTILDIVNRSYFRGVLDLDITYTARPSRRIMGRHEQRRPRSLVLINPLLDHALVKAWYVHYLVFHECLHELIPPRNEAGRQLLHPPEFRRHERLHPDAMVARTYEAWITGSGHAHLLDDYRRRHHLRRRRKTATPTAARRSHKHR